MEEEDFEDEYRRDRAFIEEEKRMRMEAEWLEAEHYADQQPAKIIVLIKIPEKHETSK